MNQLFDRYILFTSTEYFVPYWSELSGIVANSATVQLIQQASRSAVEDFISDGDVYWEADFSPYRHERTAAVYFRALENGRPSDETVEPKLRQAFCPSDSELKGSDFSVAFLYRISRSDEHASASLGLDQSDIDLVAACLPGHQDEVTDLAAVINAWLDSSAYWDLRIRCMTPDQPEYVAVNFASVWRARSFLPRFVQNVLSLVGTDEGRRRIAHLSRALQADFPKNASLAIPAVLAA